MRQRVQAAERERLRGAGREGSSSTTAIGGQAALEMVGVQLGGVTARGRVLGTYVFIGEGSEELPYMLLSNQKMWL